MKCLSSSTLVISLLLMPGILASQESRKPTPQREAVKIINDHGDTVRMKTVKEPPPDYVPYDQGPEVLNQEQPKYPALALKAGLEGTVWVKLWVDESGRVVQVYVVKADAQIFEQAALDAARLWRFKPALSKGKPVATWVSVPFRFRLAGYPTETRTDAAFTRTTLGERLGMGWPEALIILSVVLLVWLARVVLSVIALIDIVRSRFVDTNDKLVWTIIAVLLPIIGPILYFVVGRKQKVKET